MQRTQIYISEKQRRALDRAARREGVSMAELVRRAIDDFLDQKRSPVEFEEILKRTGGSMPNLEVPPRSEWDRGYG